MKRISLLILSLLFFATAFQSDKLITQGWYQQFLPAGGYKPIAGMVFVDSLTGFIVTGADTVGNTNYIFKTTDGGDNWNINFSVIDKLRKIQFINDSSGFAMGTLAFYKTTNRGISWNTGYLPGYPYDTYVLNKDTIFCADDQSVIGGFWRTTNGGTSWQMLVNFGSLNPSGVYFYNKNIGYINRGGGTWKTTDGGFNWFQIPGPYGKMYFFDSLFGYKAAGFTMSKTTDGGMNWTLQQLPNTFDPGMLSFSCINKDTIFGAGGIISNNGYNGIIYKTTNGGENWGYQQPLINNSIFVYSSICFSNKLNIWAYKLYSTGVHTKVGGNDTTFFTGIKLVPSIVPEKFSLGQNYPNPFNPTTNIPFELKEPSHITLKVFDARGREVKELVNGRWGTGKFIADFDVRHGGSATIATGIYFYQIIVSGESTHQTFAETRKMMVIK